MTSAAMDVVNKEDPWVHVQRLKEELEEQRKLIEYVKNFMPAVIHAQGFFDKFETEADMQVSRLRRAGLASAVSKKTGPDDAEGVSFKCQEFLHIVTDLLIKLHQATTGSSTADVTATSTTMGNPLRETEKNLMSTPSPAARPADVVGPNAPPISLGASPGAFSSPGAGELGNWGGSLPVPSRQGEFPASGAGTAAGDAGLVPGGPGGVRPGVAGAGAVAGALPLGAGPRPAVALNRSPEDHAPFAAGTVPQQLNKTASGAVGVDPAPPHGSPEGQRGHWLLSRDNTPAPQAWASSASATSSQKGVASKDEPPGMLLHGDPSPKQQPEPAAEPEGRGGAGYFASALAQQDGKGLPPAAPTDANGEPLVLGQGSWANAYRYSVSGGPREAFELLFRVGIVTARELTDDDTLVAQDHVEECRAIAEDMLRSQPLSFWTAQQQEAKNYFEQQLTLLYTRKFGTPASPK